MLSGLRSPLDAFSTARSGLLLSSRSLMPAMGHDFPLPNTAQVRSVKFVRMAGSELTNRFIASRGRRCALKTGGGLMRHEDPLPNADSSPARCGNFVCRQLGLHFPVERDALA
jgi:hypothetical protein